MSSAGIHRQRVSPGAIASRRIEPAAHAAMVPPPGAGRCEPKNALYSRIHYGGCAGDQGHMDQMHGQSRETEGSNILRDLENILHRKYTGRICDEYRCIFK
jgi:hypothetical protein